ncbi:MAG: hypothetical protein ASARMPREDX12_002199 [Alectoria sarmentosa]|nr:MAG: hypothetical protein ASARMPREDX12_002199 [Alectoria sarmentosa]CAD6577327.1 MAG: hypothetical protein ASARMPRED_008222 [Alectoria sarmentosa]
MASIDQQEELHVKCHTSSSSSLENEGVGNPRHGEAAHNRPEPQGTDKHSWRFWLVFLSMCLISFASALDSTIITTALPTITREIGGQQQYAWIANSFVVASTAVQPLVGQMSNIFGRRMPMMISVALFASGSGIAGGSNSVAMMIAGRTVQGLGSGGIFVLVDLITCDLVPLRERGKYLGLMLSTAAIGTTIGPLAGGGLAQASWRWVFYINLPISGVALVTMVFFLRTQHKREPSWGKALARVDYLGNLIFVASLCAILLGLILGGTAYPWSSWRIIVPLVLGILGWACFHLHQASSLCKEPSMPPRLFTNRTSVIGFLLTFNSALLLEWVVYFLPLYFQAVLGASPLISGVDILPLNVFLAPFAIIAGILLSKFGRYRPIHWTGFAFTAIGCGLFSVLKPTSTKAAWVCFQLITAIGLGFIMTTILPSIQAALPESDAATATGTFAFVRSFGFVWGITIPSVIFKARFDKLKFRISDESVRSVLANGGAYGYASGSFIKSLSGDIRAEVLSVYTDALKAVWDAAIAFSLLSFFAVFIAKDVELRTELETEFGLDGGKKKDVEQNVAEKDNGSNPVEDDNVKVNSNMDTKSARDKEGL